MNSGDESTYLFPVFASYIRLIVGTFIKDFVVIVVPFNTLPVMKIL